MKLKPIEIAALAGFGWLTLQALKPKGTSGVGANFRVWPNSYKYDLDVELENKGWVTLHDVRPESVKQANHMAKAFARGYGEKLRSYMLVNANTQERVQYWPDGTKIHHWER